MPRRNVRCGRLIAWSLVLSLLCAATAGAQDPRFNVREVKAAFLFNFVQFVSWPTDAFSSESAPFVIGILGDDPFAGALAALVKDETVNGRRIVVSRFARAEEAGGCHILFVTPRPADQYAHVFTALADRPILTVGDTDGFTQHGGGVRFVTERNRIRLQVNIATARHLRLAISSNLLRAAEVIDGERSLP